MSNGLDIIVQLDKKIHQLPPQLLNKIDNYVDFLLYKSQTTDISTYYPQVTTV